MKKIMVIFGTRPEAIKMCPLVNELKKRKKFDIKVCVTGQHKEMLDQVLSVFHIKPDYNLEIMKRNQTLFDVSISIMDKMKDVLAIEKPNLILVHGDTTTTFISSLSAFYLNIPIGHVEAGLRTNNIHSPFPEEFNRQAVSLLAKYNFAPTERSKKNLILENRSEESIFVTGNTVIDALKTTVSSNYNHKYLEWVGDNKLILVTAHRRENLGNPMRNMFNAINRILKEFTNIRVIYPIHLNPKIRILAEEVFKENRNIKLIEPLDVIDFHNFMYRANLILTDSGGIQEEAPSLGKPVLVMRDTTERPEGVKAGTLRLVGTSEDEIYRNFKLLLTNQRMYDKMSKAINPYGNGKSSSIICDIIEKHLL
ncbi:non-hydrolyzing UDP-N-acetylglucosamine 2-epimerase [Candidatus Izemoplasma sp. B36]|uniref:non-hydrolyzing UDP-N-acetylglucosamine 2-epimerase n=1 Tax=Candidatus Izemoplasma sp. B36 TaxID=3242468 RepID=UPI0035584B46